MPVTARFDTARGWQGTQYLIGTGPNNTPGQPTSVLQALFDEPGVHTVQLQSLTSTIVRAIGIVNWSTEGGQVQRIFDIGAGVQISGVANGVSVSVYDATGAVAALNVQYQVTAQVSKGLRPPSGTVSLFGPATLVAHGGGAVNVNVPSNAGIVSVQLGLSTGNDNALPVVEAKITVGPISTIGRVPGTTQYVTIPSGATQIQFNNYDAANDVTVSIAWGIDG